MIRIHTCWKTCARIMGRRGRNNRRGSGNAGGSRRQQDGQRGNYSLALKENAQFEKYYKLQNIVPEGDWDTFMEILRTDLPTTFRITGCKTEAKELLKKIKSDYFSTLTNFELEDGTTYEGMPECLDWYPQEMAWQLNLDRKFIRHSGHLEKLHQFLIAETESGFISRQEAVSMIPPLLMDIKPDHKVLDMCAAPGSKTAQMLEMLHADESTPIPEGFIVANDVDFKRCYLLIHQLQRLASPCFAVINHDASRIPNLRINDDESSKMSVQFDRILADVPCTGDGTMRKNKDVWQKWNPINATNLHGVQKRILRRGVEMLAVGGRIVYSTCSLNPVENEAVVAHVLKECQGSIELIDVSHELPELKFKPGISTWKVMTKQEEVYEKLEEVPDRLKTIILPSLFPPDEETAKTLHLDKCMRLLPHLQNTGGFFVAVMKKVKQLPWLPDRRNTPVSAANKTSSDAGSSGPVASDKNTVTETDRSETPSSKADKSKAASEETNDKTKDCEASAGDDNQDSEMNAEVSAEENGNKNVDSVAKRKAEGDRGGRPPKRGRYLGNKEDPFIYLEPDDSFWPPIKHFYGMKDEFPVDQLMIRCGDGKRRHIYFTNKAIKDIVKYNEARIKFVNLGMKVLSRCDSPYADCDFRLVQDGVPLTNHFITKRIVNIPAEDIVILLGQENPFCYKFTKETADVLDAMEQGGCMFRYTPDGKEGNPECDIVLCGWKAKVSARSFMAKQGRFHYLFLCGQELSPKPPKERRNQSGDNDEEENNGENTGNQDADNPAMGDVLDIRPQLLDEVKMEVKPDADAVCQDAVKVELKEEIKSEVKSESTEAETSK